jgi:hypothetical protein
MVVGASSAVGEVTGPLEPLVLPLLPLLEDPWLLLEAPLLDEG